jgi:hypothetical protein
VELCEPADEQNPNFMLEAKELRLKGKLTTAQPPVEA